ncbi:hypothetical protein I7I50_12699 [Histoplasma capsulatum G186AR]|uniref:Uncharacterized protein n=1 Tax=Ajellomyces capsulatus TaxID=5037 RepID=A0A8H7YC80_AJECA|nr:hypothetical protein I7I52_10996 [Histoplasma capsulatum]QSS70916.1 hypothetical protein I7I50_12699 [Histoplasma capsulatum G186AR]
MWYSRFFLFWQYTRDMSTFEVSPAFPLVVPYSTPWDAGILTMVGGHSTKSSGRRYTDKNLQA